MRRECFLALLLASVVPIELASAQEVVSAQAGVVHYLEGAVMIDGSAVDHKPAVFPLVKDGSTLQTAKGRVELLLTPGTFLRLDENSSIKMVSGKLSDTRIAFLNGSAILDALAAGDNIPITIQFKGASIHFPKIGLYRIDSETGVLQAYSGEALVEQEGRQTRVDTSRLYFFELATDTKKFSDGADDEFLDWARNRNQAINEENQMAQADADDATGDADTGSLPPLFNYSVPPITPSYGSIYSYGGFLYNPYVPTGLFALPPLPYPALIVTRPFLGYRGGSHWPSSGIWRTGTTSTVHPIHPITPSWPRPVTGMTSMPHPAYVHPVATPRISAPAVHAVGHR